MQPDQTMLGSLKVNTSKICNSILLSETDEGKPFKSYKSRKLSCSLSRFGASVQLLENTRLPVHAVLQQKAGQCVTKIVRIFLFRLFLSLKQYPSRFDELHFGHTVLLHRVLFFCLFFFLLRRKNLMTYQGGKNWAKII